VAKLGVIAVFLAAYGIPVTFHAAMSVMAGSSISGAVAITPGGVGVRQATDAAILSGSTGSTTATAYSLGQQLAITVWNIAFAVIVVAWAFGWAGGKQLVERSYADAQAKAAEQRAQRDRKRAARRPA
jgi:uncharacterized membrane protein YbhN (UPF0104 family)